MRSLVEYFDEYIENTEYDSGNDLAIKEKYIQKQPERVNPDGSRSHDASFVMAFLMFKNRYMHFHAYYPSIHREYYNFYDVSNFNYTVRHTHEFIELGYVVQGTLRLWIKDGLREFHTGEICLINSNTEHCENYEDDTVKVIYLSLSHELFDSIMNSDFKASARQNWLRSIVIEKKEHYQYIRFRPLADDAIDVIDDTADSGDKRTVRSLDTIESIVKESIDMYIGSYDIIKGNMIRLVHLLTTEYAMELTKAEKEQYRYQLYCDVCSYIKANYSNINIGMLSEHFHYSNDFFNRLIKEFSGETYIEYLQNERLRQAELMLLQTQMPVSAIAERVGYNNLGYFYKIFKNKYGKLPAEYRCEPIIAE